MVCLAGRGAASGRLRPQSAAMNGTPESVSAEGRAKVGEIYHLPTGLPISEDGLIEMLSGAPLVSVGETHDNLNDSVSSCTWSRARPSFPGRVAVGMEIFREPQQAVSTSG